MVSQTNILSAWKPRPSLILVTVTIALSVAACRHQSSEREFLSISTDEKQNTEKRDLLPVGDPPPGTAGSFTTDFTRHTIPYSEIISGGPRKDGIPAIDHPDSRSVDSLPTDFLPPTSPLLIVTRREETRGYPIGILMRHEIVNDTLGDNPIAVTYCPLCNSGIAFDRRHGAKTLDFGTTGRLRLSNLVMYDRQTESWWQQGTGECIVGEFAGERLELIPATILSWAQFRSGWPGGSVLLPPGGRMRRYRRNPYEGYDDTTSSRPFLYEGDNIDERLPAMTRVLGLFDGETAIAFPYSLLRERNVLNVSVGALDLVVLWMSGTSSALDTDLIEQGRDVGGAIAFDRRVKETLLTFECDEDGVIRDRETGSRWSIAGVAVEGPLQGNSLQQLGAWNYFWFSWAALHPETALYSDD